MGRHFWSYACVYCENGILRLFAFVCKYCWYSNAWCTTRRQPRYKLEQRCCYDTSQFDVTACMPLTNWAWCLTASSSVWSHTDRRLVLIVSWCHSYSEVAWLDAFDQYGSLPWFPCRHQQPSEKGCWWKRRRGRPALTRTRTVVSDLKPCNIAFTLPGIGRRTEMRGTDLCRQLCPSLGSALDDD